MPRPNEVPLVGCVALPVDVRTHAVVIMLFVVVFVGVGVVGVPIIAVVVVVVGVGVVDVVTSASSLVGRAGCRVMAE